MFQLSGTNCHDGRSRLRCSGNLEELTSYNARVLAIGRARTPLPMRSIMFLLVPQCFCIRQMLTGRPVAGNASLCLVRRVSSGLFQPKPPTTAGFCWLSKYLFFLHPLFAMARDDTVYEPRPALTLPSSSMSPMLVSASHQRLFWLDGN